MKNFKATFLVFRQNKQATFGLVVMCIFLLFAIFGPLVYGDLQTDYAHIYQGPSFAHPLGTDFSGKDTLGQFVLGTRDVIIIAAFAGFFTISIGLAIGLISGFTGGVVDDVLMLITNVVITIPSFPVLMVMSLIFDASNPIVFGLILSLWSWGGLAKSIRTQVMSVKNSEFVLASKVIGLSKTTSLRFDILPQIIPFILVSFVLVMKSSVLSAVGLMMLGLAPFQGEHWGMMLNLAMSKSGAIFGSSALVYLITPIVGIMLFQLSLFMISKGIEDAFNPRKRGALDV